MAKTDTKPKKIRRARKEKNIRSGIMRAIMIILLIAILVPSLVYFFLPDWAFYMIPATRLWLATDEISAAYKTSDFEDALVTVAKQYDSGIEIFSPDNRFIYSSENPNQELSLPLSDMPSIDEEYRMNYETHYGSIESSSDKGYLIKSYTDGGVSVTFLDCFVFLPDGSRAEVCMQVSQSVMVSKIDFVILFVLMMAVIITALSIVWVYLKHFTQPIHRIVDVTEKMAKLDFDEKCPETGLSEMNSLSESINILSSTLDTTLGDLREKNKKLEKDIENERTIDALRQTFIGGISHELKTPIAIIRGYAEGAKMFYEGGNKEMADSYCQTVIDESERMNSMIMKLLEITKYDSGAYTIQTENFYIYELVQDWLDRNVSAIEEKGVKTENNIDALYFGNGDKIILASVVNNYLSNAMSHVEGDMTISARAEDMGDFYRVFIFNSGKQIAEKDIDKIWTSFYRADKSLSRSQGRFGLGLAIVASIQRLHGRDYGVNNVDGGVEFYFDITKGQQ